jgi:threonine efflux protein
MSYAWPLAGLAAANFVGIVSPGPAFLMVSRAAIGRSRGIALGLSAGIAMAATIWAMAACFGLAVLMSRFTSVYGAIQLAGGAYLIWLGLHAWRGAGKAETTELPEAGAPRPEQRDGIMRSILLGAMLSLGNPKIVIFFTSIFVALLPAHAPLWVRLAATAIVGVQEIAWYMMIALVFSRPRMQAAYRSFSAWIERVTGTVLIGFGARVLTSVRI